MDGQEEQKFNPNTPLNTIKGIKWMDRRNKMLIQPNEYPVYPKNP
jgi:hypothetical protein